jgi:hypothetical protein
MEDASAVDLDWFWRGWFYETQPVDVAINEVKWFQLNTQNPTIEKGFLLDKNLNKDQFIGDDLNKTSIVETINERDKDINDFYAKRNKYAVDAMDIKEYNEFISKLSPKELEILNANKQFYEVLIDNIGGLVTPLIFEFTFKDNTEKIIRIPAEVWRLNEKQISKVFIFDKEVTSIRLDPFLETADVNLSNNSWPENKQPSRYQLFKQQGFKGNLMQRQLEVDKLKKD